MRTIAVALSVLVLVAVIQDSCGAPRRNGQRGAQRTRPEGEREGRRGRPHNKHHGEGVWCPSRHHPKPCMLRNVTTSEVLCNNTCPDFTTCTNRSAGAKPQLDDSLEVHVCALLSCEAADQDSCPAGTTCMSFKSEQKCVPDICRRNRNPHHPHHPRRPHHPRHQHQSSEESSEDESSEQASSEEASSEEGTFEENSSEESIEDSEHCGKVLRNLFRPAKHHPRGKHIRLCLLRNITSNDNDVLCNNTCPDFADCQKGGEMMKHLMIESVEAHFCIPKKCVPGANSCPAGSRCQHHGSESRCMPPKHRVPRQPKEKNDGEEEEDDDEQDICKKVLIDILELNSIHGEVAPKGRGKFAQGSDSERPSHRGQRQGTRGNHRDGRDNFDDRQPMEDAHVDFEQGELRFGRLPGNVGRRSRGNGPRGSRGRRPIDESPVNSRPDREPRI